MHSKDIISHPWFWIVMTFAAHRGIRLLWRGVERLAPLIRSQFEREDAADANIDRGPTLAESLRALDQQHQFVLVRAYTPIG